METSEQPTTVRWPSHRILSAGLRALVFSAPVVISIIGTIVVSRVLPRPSGLIAVLGWWVLLSALATAIAVAVGRFSRRLLPVTAMVGVSLAFPDRVPSRLKLALRSGSIADLDSRIDAARMAGIDGDETQAAEGLLELVSDLNTHDRQTRGHAERVRGLSQLIAEELDLSEEERDKLNWSALLHDVGKLSVDRAVLTKPGRLSDDEWEQVKTHPVAGDGIVAPLRNWLGSSLHAVDQHHEWWDGTGYPRGLAGEEIALSARIVSVADAFDAMTTPNSYSDTLNAEEARAELARGAGTQFDPDVVRAFFGISLRRVRLAMGPLSWLANVPFIGAAPLAPASAAVFGAAVGVGALVTGGVGAGAGAEQPPVPFQNETSVVTSVPSPEAPPTETTVESPITDGPPGAPPPTVAPVADPPPPSPDPPPPTPGPSGPDAPAIEVAVDEDGQVVIDLSEGGTTVSIVDPPDVGTVSSVGGDRVAYEPDRDVNGTDRFDYRRCNGGGCATGPVTVTIRPVNDPPRVFGKGVGTNEDRSVVVDVTAGALDVDGDTVTVRSVGSPTKGRVAIVSPTSVRYTPDTDAVGFDSFSFVAGDGHGGTDGATVNVAVTPVNDPPSFTAGANELVTEDSGPRAASGWVSAVSPGPADESGQSVAFVVVTDKPSLFSTQPAVSPTGTLTYTPAPDANGTATVTVSVFDDGGTANGGTDTSLGQDADIVIAAVNDDPVAGDDPDVGDDPADFSTVRSAALFIPAAELLDNDTDPELDVLSLAPKAPTGTAEGSAQCDATGCTYTPSGVDDGPDTFDYTVTDGNGGSDTATVTVDVTVGRFPIAAAGADHSCFGLADGTVWCTGDNTSGQLGTGDNTQALTPVQVVGEGGVGFLGGVVEITAGSDHSCAVKDDGTVWCWGDGTAGELGDGAQTDSSTPVQVAGVGGVGFLTGAVEVAGGEDFSCAVIDDGTVNCWGTDAKEQLGNGPAGGTQASPVRVLGPGGVGSLTGVSTVATGIDHSCAVKADGTAWCWGSNVAGRLGDGTTTAADVPVQVVGPGGVGFLTGAVAIDVADSHSCAVGGDGTIRCWGGNGSGRLGDGTTTSSPTPVQVVGPGGVGFLAGAVDIGTGGAHSCAALTGGTAWCWGQDTRGQLGDGSPPSSSSSPVQVVGPGGVGFLTGVTSISEGSGWESHSCAAQSVSIWCWGRNQWGQLGGGSPPTEHEPVQAI